MINKNHMLYFFKKLTHLADIEFEAQLKKFDKYVRYVEPASAKYHQFATVYFAIMLPKNFEAILKQMYNNIDELVFYYKTILAPVLKEKFKEFAREAPNELILLPGPSKKDPFIYYYQKDRVKFSAIYTYTLSNQNILHLALHAPNIKYQACIKELINGEMAQYMGSTAMHKKLENT